MARPKTPATNKIKKPVSAAPKKPKAAEAAAPVGLALNVSRHFDAWLAGLGISVAFSTKRASKLFLIGRDTDGNAALAERTIDACGALAASRRSLYAASAWQIWRFENALSPHENVDGYDAVYVPKASHVTGAVDCRDMAVDADGRLIFVTGRFNCLAYMSRDYSFHPIWRPSFISAYAAEDRCGLSGLAMRDGHPAFTTAAGASDTARGWENNIESGGILIDVRTKDTIAGGLCLPAAPRLVGNTLWLIETGSGFLSRVDTRTGHVDRVTRCPGFPTSMAVVGNFAVMGLARAGTGADTDTLPLGRALAEVKGKAKCGLAVVELTSGNVLHWVAVEGVVDEISGVCVLPGMVRPRAVGFKSDEIARTISLPPELD